MKAYCFYINEEDSLKINNLAQEWEVSRSRTLRKILEMFWDNIEQIEIEQVVEEETEEQQNV